MSYYLNKDTISVISEAGRTPVGATTRPVKSHRKAQVELSLADDRLSDVENLLTDREDLALDIQAILRGHPHAPEILAKMFLSFRRAIESGLQGINQTSNTLLAAIGLIYLHSNAHTAALRLYLLSQQGELKFEDEPLNLINAAIGRSTARVHSCRKARHAKKVVRK